MSPQEWREKFEKEFGYPLNLEDDEIVESLQQLQDMCCSATDDNVLDFLDGRHVAKWMSMW